MPERVIPPYSLPPAARQIATTRPYLTIAEAAELVRVSAKRLRNLMSNGTLKEGVHYTRPRGLAPRFRREPLVDWIEGRDEEDVGSEPKRASRVGPKVDLSLIPRLHGRDDGL